MSRFPITGVFAVLLPLAVSSCDHSSQQASADPEWIRLEGLRVELSHKISVAEIKLARLDRSRDEGNSGTLENLSTLRARGLDLVTRRENLESAIAALESDLAGARHRTLESARSSAVGLQYPQLDTRTGNHYEQVKILAVNDSGVKISHSSGISHLGSEDLDPAFCERVGLDKDLELAANQRLKQQEQAFEQQTARDLAVVESRRASIPAPVVSNAALALAEAPSRRSLSSGITPSFSSTPATSYYYRSRPTVYYYYYNPSPSYCYHPNYAYGFPSGQSNSSRSHSTGTPPTPPTQTTP